MVLDGFVGGFGWFWVVLGGFGGFRVLVTTSLKTVTSYRLQPSVFPSSEGHCKNQ